MSKLKTTVRRSDESQIDQVIADLGRRGWTLVKKEKVSIPQGMGIWTGWMAALEKERGR